MPTGGDTDRSVRVSLVADQPIVRVGFVQIVQNRGELQQAQISVGEQSIEIVVGTGSVGHGSVALRQPNCTRTL